jgi:hypothetical protein
VDEFKSPMDFQHYIEGREGSTFEIELVNNNPYDCEFIVSVDGLSITDGEAAGEQSGGYVVPANTTQRVPGWMVNGETAAKFTFSGAKGQSYAEQSEHGDARNKGVIATKVFARQGSRNAYRPPSTVMRNTSFNPHQKMKGMAPRATFDSGNARGISDSWSYTSDSMGSVIGASLSSNNAQFQNCVAGAAASVTPQALDSLQVG